MEILVIDDHSSDNTIAVVSDMARQYQQIRLLTNEREKGPSGTRNTGLLRSRGEYVAFLDADDTWFPNHLKAGIGFLEDHCSIDIVFYNVEIYDCMAKRKTGDWFSERDFISKLKTEELEEQYYIIHENIFHALLDEAFMHLQSMIVRKKILAGILFNEDIKRSEDRDFCIRMYVCSNARFAFKNLVTGTYIRREKSLTSESDENALSASMDHIRLFSGYLSMCSSDSVAINKLNVMIYNRYMGASYLCRKKNNHKLAMKYLIRSYKYKISFFQFVEFFKISVSLVLFLFLIDSGKKPHS